MALLGTDRLCNPKGPAGLYVISASRRHCHWKKIPSMLDEVMGLFPGEKSVKAV
jgi:hypothetical protein